MSTTSNSPATIPANQGSSNNLNTLISNGLQQFQKGIIDEGYHRELKRIEDATANKLRKIEEDERLDKERIDEETAREIRRINEDATRRKGQIEKEARAKTQLELQNKEENIDREKGHHLQTSKLIGFVGSSLSITASPLNGAQTTSRFSFQPGPSSTASATEPPEIEEEVTQSPGMAFITRHLDCTEVQYELYSQQCKEHRFDEESLVEHLKDIHKVEKYRCLAKGCEVSYTTRYKLDKKS